MREFLKGLELDRETIDSIMAEYGKNVQGLREKVDELRESNMTLKESSQIADSDRTELETFRQERDAAKAKTTDEALTNNILESFGSKQFTSDYAKNGLISDIKSELGKEENVGKSITEITDYLTKDKTGIFANPNKPADMPPMGEAGTPTISSEAFAKMSYNERVELKANDPDLFEQLNK